MGKAYKRTGPPAVLQPASGSVHSQAEVSDAPPPRHTVDLGDATAIKRTLDDVAAQEVLSSGFREDHTVSNLKICLGIFTCCWALLAQFYPKKYPHNWHVLVLCLVCYIACTAVLNALIWFVERDSFLFTRKPQGQQAALSLLSLMPKYQDVYTLQLQSRDTLTSKPRMVAELKKSVTSYFDGEGSLLEAAFRHDVQQALKQHTGKGKKRS